MGIAVLDAGVVIAGLDFDDRHHEAAAEALRTATARGDSFVLPASAYADVLMRPAVRGSAAVTRVDDAIDVLAVEIAAATRHIARRAATLRARHASLRLSDALVIATAIELDAQHLLTTDKRWSALRRLGLHRRLVIVQASAKGL